MEFISIVTPLACFVAIFVFIPMYRTITKLKDEIKKYKDREDAEKIKNSIRDEVIRHMEAAHQKERSYT